MRSIIRSILVGMALVAPAAAQTASPPLPKEGPVDNTAVCHGTNQLIVFDKDFAQITYDSTCTVLAKMEGGFGDRTTGRCVGSLRIIKGKLETEIGGCRWNDASGDTFYSAHTLQSVDASGHVLKNILIGGTGKYSGITGSLDVLRQGLPSPGDGRGASINFTKGTYKLP